MLRSATSEELQSNGPRPSFWLLRTRPDDPDLEAERYKLVTSLIAEVSKLNDTYADIAGASESCFDEADDAIAEDQLWFAYHMACKVSRNIDFISKAMSRMGAMAPRPDNIDEFHCPICITTKRQVPHVTTCDHAFCVDCWDKWFVHCESSMALTCPICRALQDPHLDV